MLMRSDCLVCLCDQTQRVLKALDCEEETKKSVLIRAAEILAQGGFDKTPPEAAKELYGAISALLRREDLYAEQKRVSTKRALELATEVKVKIEGSKSPADYALRAAVAGNVIDFAAEREFDIEKELKSVFETPFFIDHKPMFLEALSKAKIVAVIGDNAGEHIFDKLMIETLSEIYHQTKFFYFVRGKPIINDVTIQEAKEAGFDEVCEVIDSGVETPGFIYRNASQSARSVYDEADLILAKGMGNFECMEQMRDERLYFLFKVKCSVVASCVDAHVGDLVCMNSAKGGC